jgi:hypothetical protein
MQHGPRSQPVKTRKPRKHMALSFPDPIGNVIVHCATKEEVEREANYATRWYEWYIRQRWNTNNGVKPPGIVPARPDLVYKDFKTWTDFWGALDV